MRRLSLSLMMALSTSALVGFGCATPTDDVAADNPDTAPGVESVSLPLSSGGLCGGERCDSVLRGAIAFFDRRPGHMNGNGRACADCHMISDSFQLSPANAEARYQALLQARTSRPDADDPLFRPIDADDYRVNGDNASDYSELRQNGLVRITIQLPPNIRMVDPATGLASTATFADVWRATPSVLNVKLTGNDGMAPAWPRGPNTTGGYQLDGRKGTLQEQAAGALHDHAQIQNPAETRFLDDVSAFQNILFSSGRVADLSRAVSAGTTPLPDPDPQLDALETQGKEVFGRSCAVCHGGAGTSTPVTQPGIPRYNDIQSGCARAPDPSGLNRWQFKACPPRLARNIRLWEITQPDGSKTRRPSSDPGRALLTGVAGATPSPFDDFGKFDNAPLRGIAKTAPYFHNNSMDTLEEVVDHYEQLFKFVTASNPASPLLVTPTGQTRVFTPAEKAPLLAYLRKL